MRTVRLYILLPVIAALMWMCGGKDDNTVADQRENIRNFLANYEYEEVDKVYRHIGNIPRDGRNKVIATGDSVIFDFAAYQFVRQRIEPTFYSNKDWIIRELKEADYPLNTLFWEQDPVKIKVGDSQLIKALEKGMVGCYEGDSVRLFLTTNLAYGANYVSSLPLDSAVEYVLWINEVKKQQ